MFWKSWRIAMMRVGSPESMIVCSSGVNNAAAHHHDDDVVDRIGLGLHRPAAVVLAQDRDDSGRDRRQQPAAQGVPPSAAGGPSIRFFPSFPCPGEGRRDRHVADPARPDPALPDTSRIRAARPMQSAAAGRSIRASPPLMMCCSCDDQRARGAAKRCCAWASAERDRYGGTQRQPLDRASCSIASAR